MTALAFDSSVLNPFARARRLDVLDRLTAGRPRVVTPAVLDELERGAANYPELAEIPRLPWLALVTSDSPAELVLFNTYVRVLGSASRNIGEASTLAWAEPRGAVVLMDDQDAVKAGRDRRVNVRRSLALLAEGLHKKLLTMDVARTLIDELILLGGARLPCTGLEFEAWLDAKGFLPP